ncbi:MAG: RNase adapter RapZ [Gammaproteobacteria bacterium]
MRLVIVTGLSGSGKSVALRTLEDAGYYCIDNLPVALLEAFANQLLVTGNLPPREAAVGIDARNQASDLNRFPDILAHLQNKGIETEILFLRADEPTLLRRYSETLRKHPLSGNKMSLADAIRQEKDLLDPIAENADIHIDTSRTNVHQLRALVRDRIAREKPQAISLLFQSFGYKHGIPTDADFVFDARCLPNPHWEPLLRPLTGLDQEVIDYLRAQPLVDQMLLSLSEFLEIWIPRFVENNRSYLSIAIGCTGGHHRSVYLTEMLASHFDKHHDDVLTRHRELS